jgi:hypothetical protein
MIEQATQQNSKVVSKMDSEGYAIDSAVIGSQKCNNKPLIWLNCNGINIKIIMY